MTSVIKVDQIETVSGIGTITIPTGNTLDASSGFIPPAGSVVQVVQTSFAGTWSASGSGTTWYNVDDLDTTITPRYSNSKILIQVSASIGSGYWEIQGRFVRNYPSAGTAIGLGNVRGNRSQCTFLDNRYEAANAVRYSWGTVTTQYLDTPGTGNTLIYGLQLNPFDTYVVGVNYNPYTDPDNADYFGTPISTLTLSEIKQ